MGSTPPMTPGELNVKTTLAKLEHLGLIELVDQQVRLTPKGAEVLTKLTGQPIPPHSPDHPAKTIAETVAYGKSVTEDEMWNTLRAVLKPKYFEETVKRNFTIIDENKEEEVK